MKKIVWLSMICVLMGLLVACADDAKIYTHINEFPRFSNMTQDGTESIDVKFDIGGESCEFIIEDENDIKAVMEIIFSLEFSKGHAEPLAPGDNTSITINQGERRVNVSVRYIAQDDRNYYLGNTLQSKIYDIAEQYGVIG